MITDEQLSEAMETYDGDLNADHYADREAMRRALEAAERAAWRPIRDAPKDGTQIIVGNKHGVWEDSQVIPGTKSKDGQPLDGHCFQALEHHGGPTHFRPLPEPPK